jgi:two-component system chemotaxis response regulator CheY
MAAITISDLSVLLVEASPTQSKAITATLNQAGISKVETVTSVSRALLTMENFIPDLVFSAMYFEHGTGTDLVTIIRSHSKLSHVPFILISSAKNHDVLDPVKQSGVVAILPKPFEFAALKRALHATLSFLDPDDNIADELDIDSFNILVVDDSTLARNHIIRVLRNLGATRILEAADGVQAVNLMKGENFDLIVTDYNMPNMDGNELVDYIRNKSGHPGIPVMMVTSDQDNARLGSIEQDGFSALCDKPFEPDNVKELLRSILY